MIVLKPQFGNGVELRIIEFLTREVGLYILKLSVFSFLNLM